MKMVWRPTSDCSAVSGGSNQPAEGGTQPAPCAMVEPVKSPVLQDSVAHGQGRRAAML